METKKVGRKGSELETRFVHWLDKQNPKGIQIIGTEYALGKRTDYLKTNGWPDFAIRRNGKLEFYEVKSSNGAVQQNQKEIFPLLKKIGKVYVARETSDGRFKVEPW